MRLFWFYGENMTLADFVSNNNAMGLGNAAPPPSAANTITNPAGIIGPKNYGTTSPAATAPSSGGGAAPAAQTTNPGPQNGMFLNEFGQWTPIGGSSGEDGVRNEINSAYDGYISSLDQQLGILGTTYATMGQQVGASNQQYQNGLDLQKTQGQDALTAEATKTDQNQKKTLQSLTDDITNQFQAGNVYLGARGAGDSSAASQYAYAIAKQGNKQRGDVMAQTADIKNEINKRSENLTNIYNTETNNNKLEYQKQMGQLAQWYSDQQSQIAGLKGSANLNRGTSLAQMSMDLLTQAKQRAQDLQDQATQKQSALETWALNNSTTLKQAQAKLGDQSAFTAPNLTRANIQGANAGTSNAGTAPVAYGYGSNTQDKNLSTLFA